MAIFFDVESGFFGIGSLEGAELEEHGGVHEDFGNSGEGTLNVVFKKGD